MIIEISILGTVAFDVLEIELALSGWDERE
jgi:hypothetical protein